MEEEKDKVKGDGWEVEEETRRRKHGGGNTNGDRECVEVKGDG